MSYGIGFFVIPGGLAFAYTIPFGRHLTTHLCDLGAGYGGDGLQSWFALGGYRTPALRVESSCDSDKLYSIRESEC